MKIHLKWFLLVSKGRASIIPVAVTMKTEWENWGKVCKSCYLRVELEIQTKLVIESLDEKRSPMIVFSSLEQKDFFF